MTALPEHPVSRRLALLAMCGDLVIAIDAMSILEIRTAEDTPARAAGHGAALLELGGALVPGFDLGELLGIAASTGAWLIVELPGIAGPVAFRLERCLTVESLPVCRAVPRGIFASRPHAIAAAFSTAAISELSARVAGVVVDLSGVLGDRERAFIAKVSAEGRAAALQA